MKIFLSCVSAELRSYRLRLANQLGGLRGAPYEVKVQEDFRQGGFTLLGTLAEYVRDCDLVIHMIGDACGGRPSAEHERALFDHLGDPVPDPLPRRSYTQWEYHLARRFKKRVLVYLASPSAPRDRLFSMAEGTGEERGLRASESPKPPPQSDEDAELQRAHVELLRRSGEHYASFSSHRELEREVFHDLGLEPDHKVNNLPYRSLGSLFKGREEFLASIRATLGVAEHKGHRRVAAITAAATAASVHGLGGIGKTRAAIEFGLRHAAEYTALLFVQADSKAKLHDSLAALCGPLVLDLPEKDTRETEIRVAAALRWLTQHPGWFLILDSVDTEEAAQAVEALLGRLGRGGQILITSRLGHWSGGVVPLALDVLDAETATSFLLERTAGERGRREQPDDPARARELAELLGELALALEQAGAYIAHNRLSFAQYLDAWRARHGDVLAWFDERVMQYPRSVAVTWQTSVAELGPAARTLLECLAWFAPDPIPEALLEVVPGAWLGDPRTALADLEAYSLVTRDADAPLFMVHRLVQDVTRQRLRRQRADPASADGPRAPPALNIALEWLDAAFVGDPGDVRAWPALVPLAPHALACARFADEAGLANPTADGFNQLGALFWAKAHFVDTDPLFRRALAIDEQSYGPEHPIVARDLNNLALLLSGTNRMGEAEPLFRRALAINENSYGPDHPAVATNLNNLAQLLNDTSCPDEAEPLFRRALGIDEQNYGPDHPNVARDLNNLALLLKDTNRLREAEPLCRRALAIAEKNHGPDHPSVATRLNNLARIFHATNRIAEAEPLFRRALAIDENSYGPDHPAVATNLHNLALLLKDTNRQGEAEPLFRRALAIDENSYGPDHPDVAVGLGALARLLEDTNRQGEAEPLFRRALTIKENSYGPDHPAVASTLNDLAQLLKDTNRQGEAEPLVRRALAIKENNYGPDHPAVATTLNDLALLLRETNRIAEAEPLFRRALAINENSYGPDHPEVGTNLNNLALLLRDTTRLKEAEPLSRRALAINENSYGPDHPGVATNLINLALLLSDTSRLGEAEPLFRRALAIHEKSYGPEHPRVAVGLRSLAMLFRDTNRLGEAEPLFRRALVIHEKSYGPDHPDVAGGLNSLAGLLGATNRAAEAERLYRRALVIHEKSYGPDHPAVARSLNNLAMLLMDINRIAEAERLLRQAVAILDRFGQATGYEHFQARVVRANLRRLARSRRPNWVGRWLLVLLLTAVVPLMCWLGR